MSDNRQFSCSKGNNRPNQGGCVNNNVMPSQYCQEFSKPPWTRPEEDSARYNQYAENQQRVNEMKAQQDNEYGMQYMARQNAGQANDECSNIPDPCSPEQGVSQNKSKPKTKKRPIKPFATTDQLRNKIFGYIENQPNLAPLTPFRGYRDDLVRQQLCCSDELVTNPPDPCPPEDPCEEWNPEQKDSSCTCPTPEPSPSCPPSNPTSGRSSASRCGRNPCSTKKKCKKVDEPKKNCESDELADILEYCKQIKGETAAMYSEGNATSQAPTYGSFSAAISPFNAPAPSTPGSSAGATKERYEPDPELRCEEEELSDEFDAEDYKDHEMFGGPDAVPRRTLNEEMKMYRLHIANIRKRYFGEMMKNVSRIDYIFQILYPLGLLFQN
ncbi:uncharacterized protein LOC111054896 [Nilaparvata lugens]|uniref:uncharacterized protein LOC111054896 n=1 Tax=Nilaparvata lugens TaxID=108931 RepID=UPI00193CCB25|nr:uncharacterized protein LOC111054896 [Nilaparvata lugens]